MCPFEPTTNKYLKLPKVGASYDFSQHGKIMEITKIDNPEHKLSRFNFMQKGVEKLTDKDGKEKEVPIMNDLGYFYKITFEDGKVLQIAAWQPFYALTGAEVKEGDLFVVEHSEKGVWRISKK